MKKKITTLVISTFCAATIIAVAATKPLESRTTKVWAETCSEWAGKGIQYRGCENERGLRSHQFYNGYKMQVHYFFHLEFTNGTDYDGNNYTDGESYSDKGANDNSSGVNNKVARWGITKKEYKDANGKWVAF